MKSQGRPLASFLAEEGSLLQYLVRPHDGHAYAEDLLDAVSLITSWVLVAVAVVSVLAVLMDGLI